MPTNAIDKNTQITYTLTATHGDNPRIEYEQTGIPKCRMRKLYDSALCSFREVQVTCDQTGELIFQSYTHDDFFEPLFPMAHTLVSLEAINDGKL